VRLKKGSRPSAGAKPGRGWESDGEAALVRTPSAEAQRRPPSAWAWHRPRCASAWRAWMGVAAVGAEDVGVVGTDSVDTVGAAGVDELCVCTADVAAPGTGATGVRNVCVGAASVSAGGTGPAGVGTTCADPVGTGASTRASDASSGKKPASGGHGRRRGEYRDGRNGWGRGGCRRSWWGYGKPRCVIGLHERASAAEWVRRVRVLRVRVRRAWTRRVLAESACQWAWAHRRSCLAHPRACAQSAR
jgi:hypothetical protein